MAVSRRNALTMLGLGATGAIPAEDLAKQLSSIGKSSSGYHFGANAARISTALRNLADDIEKGGSHAQQLTFESKFGVEDFLIHTLSIQFAMQVDDDATS